MKHNHKQHNKPDIKVYKQMFYRHNHLLFVLAIVASVLTALFNLAISWLIQQIIDLLSDSALFTLTELIIISLSMLAMLVLFMLLDYFTRPAFIKKAIRQYKNYAFEQITKKSISSFTEENTSTYLSALTNDVTSIETNYLSNLFQLIMKILLFVGAFTMMLFYSPLLTLAAFLFSVVPIIGSLVAGNSLAPAEKRVSDQNESFLGMVKDALAGFSVIKSFKAEAQMIKTFMDNNQTTEDVKCKRRKIEILIEIIGTTASVIAQFGVFIFGAYLAVSGRNVTPGIVIVFVQLMNFVLEPISTVPQILANRKAASALIEKLASTVRTNVRRDGIAVSPILKNAVEIKDLSFSYEENVQVLSHINLRFEPGKSYALVGSSGSGKSTLLSLLMGSRDDYTGKILFDENELRNISSDSLYDLISIVQQKVFIFNHSIQNNITMFRDFEDSKVQRAIKMSGLAPLLAERGTDYLCGENGAGLSGGEQQRISIARCLLHETPILLVDEATASLDAKTAFEVTNSILELPDVTRIVVTHRLEEALLCKYDEILVLKNGTVEESGTFAQLMEQKAYFYSLFTVSQ